MDNYRDIMYRDRPAPCRPRMDTAHRAKQFAPFAALKGYEEAVSAQRIIYMVRPILAEDRQEELDRQLESIKAGSLLAVRWFEPKPGNPEIGLIRETSGPLLMNCGNMGSVIAGETEIPADRIIEIEEL